MAAYFGFQGRNDVFKELIAQAKIDYWNPIKAFVYV
jgi:hypothetical protein